jgi:hypothetical protein
MPGRGFGAEEGGTEGTGSEARYGPRQRLHHNFIEDSFITIRSTGHNVVLRAIVSTRDEGEGERMNLSLANVIIASVALSFCGHASAEDIAAPGAVTCQGPFARDSSHLMIARIFGDKNVVVQEVEGGEGTKLSATIIYPNDLRRRLEILWKNENARQGIDVVSILGESQWTVGRDLKLGMTLDEVEALNGGPFEIRNFNLESGGTVMSWRGGALSKNAGGCRVSLGFAPADGTPASAYQKIGFDDILSNDPTLRALLPKVVGLGIHYRGN